MLKRVLLLTAVLGLVAAACGGEDGAAVASAGDIVGSPTSTVASITDDSIAGAEPSADASEEVSTEQALLDLAACMRNEGIDMDDPQVDSDGTFRIGAVIRQASNSAPNEIRKAMEVCAVHLEGVTLGFRDFDLTELQDQMLEFADCMRSAGYDMPDPDFSNFGIPGAGQDGASGPFGEIDPTDTQFQAALEDCQDILSFGRFGAGRPGDSG